MAFKLNSLTIKCLEFNLFWLGLIDKVCEATAKNYDGFSGTPIVININYEGRNHLLKLCNKK